MASSSPLQVTFHPAASQTHNLAPLHLSPLWMQPLAEWLLLDTCQISINAPSCWVPGYTNPLLSEQGLSAALLLGGSRLRLGVQDLLGSSPP